MNIVCLFPEYAAKHKGFLPCLKRAWDQDSEGDSVGRAPRAAPSGTVCTPGILRGEKGIIERRTRERAYSHIRGLRWCNQ